MPVRNYRKLYESEPPEGTPEWHRWNNLFKRYQGMIASKIVPSQLVEKWLPARGKDGPRVITVTVPVFPFNPCYVSPGFESVSQPKPRRLKPDYKNNFELRRKQAHP